MYLDCESFDSTVASIASLYGITAENVVATLRGIKPPEEFHDWQKWPREVCATFEKEVRSQPQAPTKVYWFHLTRTKRGRTFAEGILPLDVALDVVWDTIIEIFSASSHAENLKVLRAEGVPNFQYSLKVGRPFYGGPFAMLVREVAFRAKEINNHDYLRLPEIMEDICQGYAQRFGSDIHNELSASLVPCIVKFWAAEIQNRDYLPPAIYYAYCKLRGEALSVYCNDCYNGENRAIPPSQIARVDFL